MANALQSTAVQSNRFPPEFFLPCGFSYRLNDMPLIYTQQTLASVTKVIGHLKRNLSLFC